MAIIIVETLATDPLTPDEPTETDRQILSCLAERDAYWQYSLLSRDRQRMFCTFVAPDAEAVRTAYRRAGGPFNRLWSAASLPPVATPVAPHRQHFTVIDATFAPGLTADQWETLRETLQPRYAEAGVEWVQAYLSLDGTRLVGELNAPTLDSLHTLHQDLNLPIAATWPAWRLQLESQTS